MAARLKELTEYSLPRSRKELGIRIAWPVPKIEKISINIGMGEATQNAKLIDGAVNELMAIAGQRPIITKARKSIAAFKLARTCRSVRRLRCAATGCMNPRPPGECIATSASAIFRGVSSKSFDGRGNYTLGMKDQLIFPEIDYNKVDKTKGMKHQYHDHRQDRCRRAGVVEAARHALPGTVVVREKYGHHRQDR